MKQNTKEEIRKRLLTYRRVCAKTKDGKSLLIGHLSDDYVRDDGISFDSCLWLNYNTGTWYICHYCTFGFCNITEDDLHYATEEEQALADKYNGKGLSGKIED